MNKKLEEALIMIGSAIAMGFFLWLVLTFFGVFK